MLAGAALLAGITSVMGTAPAVADSRDGAEEEHDLEAACSFWSPRHWVSSETAALVLEVDRGAGVSRREFRAPAPGPKVVIPVCARGDLCRAASSVRSMFAPPPKALEEDGCGDQSQAARHSKPAHAITFGAVVAVALAASAWTLDANGRSRATWTMTGHDIENSRTQPDEATHHATQRRPAGASLDVHDRRRRLGDAGRRRRTRRVGPAPHRRLFSGLGRQSLEARSGIQRDPLDAADQQLQRRRRLGVADEPGAARRHALRR